MTPPAPPHPLRILTSWPTRTAEGSGTATFLHGFVTALRGEAIPVTIEECPALPPVHEYDRLLAARAVANEAWRELSLEDNTDCLGLDWDGHRLTEAQRTGRQVIVTPRGLFADLIATEPALAESLAQQAAWERANVTQADWIFVASHYARRQVAHYYGCDPARIAVLPNGLNPIFRSAFAQAESFDWPMPTILAAAKFYPRKQIPLLIEAFADCRARGLQARLCVLGDGFEAPRIHELIVRHRLAEWVDLPGLLTDPVELARYFRSCTLFCHPSIQETFGNVVLEAIAAGKPVVCADAASLPEVAGPLGFYVPPGDREALSEALESAMHLLMSEPALRAEITDRALAWAAGFSWERTALEFEECRRSWRDQQELPSGPHAFS